MNVAPSIPFFLQNPCGTFVRMDQKKRHWVKITDDVKRMLTHLSVDAGASSVEEFAGDLLEAVVRAKWDDFDPKRAAKPKAKK